jgi:hypothetical protein
VIFSIQICAGMSVAHGSVATLYIVFTGAAGALFWLRFVNPQQTSLVELAGIGLVISTIVIALLNLLYRTVFSGFPVSTIAFTMFSCFLFFLVYPRFKSVRPASNGVNELDISVSGALVTGYLSALSTYMYPIFLAFIIISLVNWKSKDFIVNKRLLASSAILAIGVLATKYVQNASSQMNPSWRWISSDTIFDTSQSVGVGRFGILDNVFSAGQQNKGYLLTYSWSGEFANLTRIPHIEVTTISFAVVALLGICFCAIGICGRLGIPKWAAYMVCGSILAQSSFPESNLGGEYLKINNMLTLLWLIGYLCLLVAAKQQQSKALSVATYLLPPIIMFGKFHFGVLALITVFTATDLFHIKKDPFRIKSVNWSHVIGSLSALFLSFLMFKLLIEFPNRWPNRFPFDSFFLKWAVVLFFFRFFGIRFINFAGWFNIRRIINTLMIFSLFAYVFSNGANNTIYFVSGSLAIASFGIFAVLYKNDEFKFRKLGPLSISVTAISAIVSFISYADYSISYFGFLTSPTSGIKKALYTQHSYLVQPILIAGMTLSIMFCIRFFRQLGNFSKRKLFSGFLVLSIFGSNLGFFLFLPIRPVLLNQKYDANEYQIFPVDSEVVEGLNYIRKNTSYDSIIASNRLCRAEIGANNETPDWPPGISPTCGNINFLSPVSAISERRQLMEAPAFNNTLGPILDPDSAIRYKLIIQFFNNPSEKDIAVLRTYSVTHLFIDKSLPWNTAVERYGNVIFENDSSIVIAF